MEGLYSGPYQRKGYQLSKHVGVENRNAHIPQFVDLWEEIYFLPFA